MLLEEEDLPAVPFRPERGPGQVVKLPLFFVLQLFMCARLSLTGDSSWQVVSRFMWFSAQPASAVDVAWA